MIPVAGCNLGLIMRLLTGAATPREFRTRLCALFGLVITPTGAILVLLLVVAADQQTAAIALSIQPDRLD